MTMQPVVVRGPDLHFDPETGEPVLDAEPNTGTMMVVWTVETGDTVGAYAYFDVPITDSDEATVRAMLVDVYDKWREVRDA